MTKYRYEIVDVRVYQDHQALQRHIAIRYLDRLDTVNKAQGVHVSLSMYDEHDDELFMMQMVTERAANQVGNPEFYEALKYWFLEGYKKKDKWTYMPYQIEPVYKYKAPDHNNHIHMAFEANELMYDTIMNKKGEIKPVHNKISNHASGTAIDFNEVVGSFKTGGTIKGAKAQSPDVGSSKKDMDAINSLPGIFEEVKHPVNDTIQQIRSIIIDLNDHHGWSREQVADWLETLDVDLRFKSVDDKIREKKAQEIQKSIDKLTAQIKLAEAGLKKMQEEMEQATLNLLELEMTTNE